MATNMRKTLYLILFSTLLLVSFVGGIRFNQSATGSNTSDTQTRRILHYVDPMNPANISSEPGIAPCGMPMEPVYADDDFPGGGSITTTPGTVRVNLQKQQIIGVQTEMVGKGKEISHIRTLGRIVANENRIYGIVAGTDGWLETVNEGTTGSLVAKNQLITEIKVYDYDFYTWQQRYLADVDNAGRRGKSLRPVSERSSPVESLLAETEVGKSHGGSGLTAVDAVPKQGRAQNPRTAMSSLQPMEAEAANPEMVPLPTLEDPSTGMASPSRSTRKSRVPYIRNDNDVDVSRARQELLDRGLKERQLAQLVRSRAYITHVELRSPVNGLVLSRNVISHQKIDRGTECFRVADLSKVWVETDIFDHEARYIQPGTTASISLPKQKQTFPARVTEILPRFDAATRTLKVRLEMDNPDNGFRPDMFVDVQFAIHLPESIAVPASAVIDSGKHKTVYLVRGEGIFVPQPVTTGWRFNDRVQIVEGLQPGENIVVAGNFLIDSESRMKLAAARLMDKPATTADLNQLFTSSAPPPPPQASIHKSSMPMDPPIKDPVCGMTVDPETARNNGLIVESQGKTHYFCSQGCVDEFHRHSPQDTGIQAAGEHKHD
jgi:YHS domain-containing protein